jgi:hypothetical protein
MASAFMGCVFYQGQLMEPVHFQINSHLPSPTVSVSLDDWLGYNPSDDMQTAAKIFREGDRYGKTLCTLTNLTLESLPPSHYLKNITLNNCTIERIDADSLPNLRKLTINGGAIGSFEGNFQELLTLTIKDNQVKFIDGNQFLKLETLKSRYNEHLLALKGVFQKTSRLELDHNRNLVSIGSFPSLEKFACRDCPMISDWLFLVDNNGPEKISFAHANEDDNWWQSFWRVNSDMEYGQEEPTDLAKLIIMTENFSVVQQYMPNSEYTPKEWLNIINTESENKPFILFSLAEAYARKKIPGIEHISGGALKGILDQATKLIEEENAYTEEQKQLFYDLTEELRTILTP